jgi:hypothetical protein
MPYKKPDSDKVRKTILNDKPRKSGQGTHKIHKIDTPEYQAKVEMVYDYIKKGVRSNEIYALMMMDDENLSETVFNQLRKDAYAYAENSLHKDRDYTFQLHMERYEDLFHKNMIMVNMYGQPLDIRQHWNIMVAKYGNALKALESKEKLLGMHDKSISLELNDQTATIVEKENDRGSIPGFDIEMLTLDEQKDLLSLIKECRTTPLEGVQRVVIKKTVIEINTETGERNKMEATETIDIGFEEMPAKVVDKFEKILDPEEVVQPEMGPIVIDSTKQLGVGKDVETVKDGLNKKMIEIFKEKLKQKRNR